MKKFVGRKSELEALEREYARDKSFVVIYGRRRVGKTTLIKEFIKDKKALYFLAAEQLESENLKVFTQDLARFTGQSYMENVRFSNWEAAFSAFAEYNSSEKKILIIDEFQYLASINPSFVSVFQRVWDEILSNANIMLIICGSLINMMLKNVLSYSSPLYGRRTAQIRLAPLSFYEIREHYSDKSFTEVLKLYSITGGVPKYIELFDNKAEIDENVKNEIFSKHGFLFEEPTFLLEREVRETVSYFSIIKSIAMGNHKLGNMAAFLEINTSQLTPYLKTLMELDIVEKRLPVTEKNPEKSKMGLYYIKDNFIEFWFKFAAPFKSELEIENMEPALKKYSESYVSIHESYVFEDVCRQTLRRICGKVFADFDVQKIGRFWNNNTEIDVCAVSANSDSYILGECKLYKKPVDADVYFDLRKKAMQINEFKNAEIKYVIFSNGGFTDRLLDIAEKNSDLILVNGEDIID